MPLIHALEDADRIDLHGGKAAKLAFLIARGFPVPRGWVVTARAAAEFTSGLQDLSQRLAGLNPAQEDGLAERCTSLQRDLAQLPLPAELVQELADLPLTGSVAVRSSATLEDTDAAAFAGQYDTFLDVDTGDIARRVRDCIVSLWSERAVRYRHRAGFPPDSAQIAVIIQPMVASRVSGVLFTVDPICGKMDHLLIDSSYGLGESVVSGEDSVDHYRVERRGFALVNKQVGAKERPVFARGTESQPAPGGECLDAPALAQLCTLGLQVEAACRFPQDIEWAIDASGALFLLQSRPVTTIPERWTRDEAAERFPQAMTPLGWEFAEAGFHDSLRHSMALLGMPVFRGRWFARFGAHVYGNQNAVDLIFRCGSPPMSNLEDVRRFFAGISPTYAMVSELPPMWSRGLDRYLLACGRLERELSNDHTCSNWWNVINQLETEGREYFRPNIAISMIHGLLHKTLQNALALVFPAVEAQAMWNRLTRVAETKTTAINREIFELAALARRAPALAALLTSREPAELLASGALASYPTFRDRFDRFISDHAHRETDPDPYQPLWGDAPWIPLQTIAQLCAVPDPADPVSREVALRADQLDAERLLFDRVPADLRTPVAELVRLCRTYSALDDLEHYQSTRLNRAFRRAVLGLGEQLRRAGTIDRAYDLFFATRASICAYIERPDAPAITALRAVIAANRLDHESHAASVPVWNLDGDGAQPPMAAGALCGIPGAPGCVEGPAFLVKTPADFAHFPRGSVLVARSTSPAWTPLFYIATGVIAESGGPLSHGAVTAREMELPAVMGVQGCLERLQNGQRVRVDGTRGTVTIL